MAPRETGKFSRFDRKDVAYRTVANHPLYASILTSRDAKHRPGASLPTLVFWHGGGFITGDRLYEPWWPQWLLEFAAAHDAIIISPDYRLLPEATGTDILDDVLAFWTWFCHDLPALADVESWAARPDVSRILCAGQSAGASIAVHSALELPELRIRAIISLYGALYKGISILQTSRPRAVGGTWPPPPRQAEATIRAYIARTKGTVRTIGDPVHNWELLACILQQGWLPRLLNRTPDPRLDTVAMLEEKRDLPPMWVIHGEQDSVLPVSCSVKFVECMKQLVPHVPVLLSMRPGDHSFDVSLTMREAWLHDGCDFLLRYW